MKKLLSLFILTPALAYGTAALYLVNPITTNTPAGMTNVILAIATNAGWTGFTNGQTYNGIFVGNGAGLTNVPSWTGETNLVWNVKSTVATNKWGGAKGDGVTRDEAAIARTVAYAGTNGGGIVWFPQGTYLVGPLTNAPYTNDDGWPAIGAYYYSNLPNGLTFAGAGKESTMILVDSNAVAPGSGESGFRPFNAYHCANVAVRDLTFDCGGWTEGVGFDLVTNGVMQNVRVQHTTNWYADAFDINSGWNLRFIDCDAWNGGTNDGQAISVQGYNIDIRGFLATNWGGYGIMINNGYWVNVSDCILHAALPLVFNGAYSVQCDNLVLDCKPSGGIMNGAINNAIGVNLRNVRMESGGWGIVVTNSYQISIADVMAGIGGNPNQVLWASNVSGLKISDVLLYGTGSTNEAIYLSRCTNFVISSCYLPSGTKPDASYADSLSMTNCDNGYVIGNNFSGWVDLDSHNIKFFNNYIGFLALNGTEWDGSQYAGDSNYFIGNFIHSVTEGWRWPFQTTTWGNRSDLNPTTIHDKLYTGTFTNGTFTGNGSGLTNLNASELRSGTVPPARAFGFAERLADSAVTNWIADFSTNIYTTITATGAINFVYATNGPGVKSLFFPAGLTHTISWPTNWWVNVGCTNVMTKNGALQTTILTNGYRGLLSIMTDSTLAVGSDQTNVLASWTTFTQ